MTMEELKKLYKEKSKMRFPSGYSGEEIKGIDLILLDSTTEGCISTFIGNEGKLDPWRMAILGMCYRDLVVVIENLDGYAKEFFEKLEKMTEIVLKNFIKDNRERYQ